jgi:hypothetical protein
MGFISLYMHVCIFAFQKKFQESHSGCEEVDRLKCIYLQKQNAFNTSGRPVMKARSGAEAEAYIQFLKAEIGKQV